MAFQTSFNKGAWSGASGTQIGFAGDYPETLPYGLGIDEIHGQAYDPNGRNLAALPGPAVDVPVIIQDVDVDYPYYSESDWILDDLAFPERDAEPGTKGHDVAFSPAKHRGNIDAAHAVDMYQEMVPQGHGVDFYGSPIETEDYAYLGWKSSSTPAPNTSDMIRGARENTANWPEPFDSSTVAPIAPVLTSDDHIPMRRLAEDDRPVYRYVAVPARNIKPSGSLWNPTYESNVYLQNMNNMIPAMPRTPVDPWITQETASAEQFDSGDIDVFDGMGLQ